LENFLKLEPEFKVGIDLGGTKIECAIIDSDNSVLYRERGSTQANLGRQQVLTNIRQQYLAAVTATGIGQHTIGLGTPGSINTHTGLLRNSSIQDMNGHDIARDLACWLHQPVAVANDAQCFALAESRLGAARGYDRVFGVIIGTGVGGALIEKGQIVPGRNGILGEWGHTTLDPSSGLDCRCGRYGCVESILGGGSIQRNYSISQHEIPPPAQVILNQDPEKLYEWYNYYGQAMANIIQILDPDCIVLGGGLSNLPDILTTGDIMIRQWLFSDTFDTVIVGAELGDSAGSIGAALLNSK
jgi:fructokinase